MGEPAHVEVSRPHLATASANDRPVAVPEGEYARYLAVQAAEIADAKSARREAVYRGIFGLVFAVVALLGYTDINRLREEIDKNIDAKLSVRVPQEVDAEYTRRETRLVEAARNKIQQDVDARLAFSQLLFVAKQLADEKERFSNADRDAAVSLLQKASKSADVLNSPEFGKPLEEIVGAFFKADLDHYLDDLDRNYQQVMVRNVQITKVLVSHYGLRVVGSPASADQATRERFHRYAEAARMHKWSELALPYEATLAFRDAGNKRNSTTDELLVDVSRLEPGERRTFLDLVQIASRADENPESGKLSRVARAFQEFETAYEPELNGLLASSPEPSDAETLPSIFP
jgi:hypothetical protein